MKSVLSIAYLPFLAYQVGLLPSLLSHNRCSGISGSALNLRGNPRVTMCNMMWGENQPTHYIEKCHLYIWIGLRLCFIFLETCIQINKYVFRTRNKNVQFYSICTVPMTVKRASLLLCIPGSCILHVYPIWEALFVTNSRHWQDPMKDPMNHHWCENSQHKSWLN